jgi:hypothetical protein
VGTTELAADAVTNAKLADNAVNTENITDGTIAAVDIANNAVTPLKIDASLAGSGLSRSAAGVLSVDGSLATDTELADAINASAALDLDKIVGNEITNATDATLVRAGAGTTASPYTLDVAASGITANELANNAVTTIKLIDNAVTSAKIADGTVATADLANNSVNSAKIIDGSIVTADLADNAVTSAKIVDGSIVAVDLANNAVTPLKIDATIAGSGLTRNVTTGVLSVDGSLATDTELADAINASAALDLDKIVGNEITNATDATLVRAGAGTTASPYTLDVAAAGITVNELADNAVTSAKIVNGTIVTADLADSSVTSAKITDGTIVTADLADNSVTTAKIADDAVSLSKLANGTTTGQIMRWNGSDWELAQPTATNVNTTVVDANGDGTNEANIQQVVDAIAPITSKAARIFYPPSIAVDASSTGTGRTLNLYTQYTAQYATPAVASAGAPAAIPTYTATQLYYYVTFFDTSVFANVSVNASGVMTYDVIGLPSDYNSLINVVFVVK